MDIIIPADLIYTKRSSLLYAAISNKSEFAVNLERENGKQCEQTT